MIYVECKPDIILVKSLIKISKREIIHAGNKPEVCKRLEKRENCIGLVDEDPWSIQPSYMKKMNVEDLSEYQLKILRDKKDNQLVVLCPMLEEWMLKTAKEAQVKLRNYKLPNDAIRLHEIININLKKVEKLIKDLKNCNRMKTLKKYLRK